MEMRAREPPRAQGRGEAKTADADGGGEPGRLQVRAVLYLRGLEGCRGGERQLLPPERARGDGGLRGKEVQEKGRALLLKVVSKGGESSLLTSRAGAQGASPHPGPQLRVSGPGGGAADRDPPE